MPPEPKCSIEWFHENYRAIWLYHRDDMPVDRFEALCRDIAEGSSRAETIADLTTLIEDVAARHGLVVRVYPGPSRVDPLRQTFRVGVFVESPFEWPPAGDSQ